MTFLVAQPVFTEEYLITNSCHPVIISQERPVWTIDYRISLHENLVIITGANMVMLLNSINLY